MASNGISQLYINEDELQTPGIIVLLLSEPSCSHQQECIEDQNPEWMFLYYMLNNMYE